MTEEDKRLLGDFEARVRHLLYMNEEMKAKCEGLQKLLDDRNVELDKLKADHEDLKRAYFSRKAAIVASLDSGDMDQTRQKLSAMVREIDKCIALLTNSN